MNFVLDQMVIFAFGILLLGSSAALEAPTTYRKAVYTGYWTSMSTLTASTTNKAKEDDETPASDKDTEDNNMVVKDSFREYWESLLDYSSLPDGDETKAYIMNFSTLLQRRIIANQLSYCPMVPLCNHALLSDYPIWYQSCCESCSCDPGCVAYGNCCPDVMMDPEQYFDAGVRQSCVWLHLLGGYDYSGNAATGIAYCPKRVTNENSQKCTQIYRHSDVTFTDILPVWHNHSNTLYRNIYCALCNGLYSKDLDFFQPEITCRSPLKRHIQTDAELIKYIFIEDQCDIKFTLPFVNLDDLKCMEMYSQCNLTGRWAHYDPDYEKACLMYKSMVMTYYSSRTVHFRNVFCAFCNGFTDLNRACNSVLVPSKPYAFTSLIAFSPSHGDTDKPTGGKQCDSGYIYHHATDKCMKMKCSFSSFLSGNECVEMVSDLYGIGYSATFRITHTTPYTVVDASSIVEKMNRLLKASLAIALSIDFKSIAICGAENYLKTNVSCEQKDTSVTYLSKLDYLLISINFSISVGHRPVSVVSSLKRIDITEHQTMIVNLVIGHDIDFRQRRQNGTFCSNADGKMWTLSPMNTMYGCYHDSTDYMYIPVTSLLTCPMINISYDLDPWIVNNGEVSFTRSDHRFKNSQFYISDNGILFLCKDQYIELYSKSVIRRWSLSVEQIVSLLCSALSIVSLLITLIVFSALAKLRTLPGKNNMALVSALLISNVLYLVGSFSRLEQGSLACKIVGILTHFTWLLVVFWMNVCTFHMFRVLTKTKMMSRGAGNTTYIIYHVYCCLAATVFVGINILVSSVPSGYSDIGYGVQNCYVSSQEMLLYTFGIPLAVVVVSNIGMFVLVVVTITKSSAVQKNVKNERNDIVVFARLSTLTGVTWIFGFFYMWTHIAALSYIFIVLNASQGVFLFISFICTTRVATIAQQRYIG